MNIVDGVLLAVFDEDIQRDGTIILPKGLTSIGKMAFKGCTRLTNVILPKSLKSIDTAAFADCTSLIAVTFPKGLISMGICAFSNCTSLTTITLPEGLSSINQNAFDSCTSLVTVNLPAGLTSIEEMAFCDCTSLTTITLPAGLTSLAEMAFNGCSSLTAITLPAELTSIGEGAFEECENIQQIVVNTGNPEVYERIKALLPANLQEKVLDFSYLNPIRRIKRNCLDRLINRPETNYLYHLLELDSACESLLSTFPAELIAEITHYTQSHNSYYAAAQKELNALSIPTSLTKENLQDYGLGCDAIAHKYLQKAMERAVGSKEKAREPQVPGFFARGKPYAPVSNDDEDMCCVIR
ncbi:leucine-rich repeat domain-containing protein [Legionella sp. PATHC035]|uniref:leucine-rich repeat domain-containing protein n=1 Tax=Legionella sp. PATHC035 TaxID=2992040 RepID=UPI002243CB36|nr:leucine-rich repeat domain-containing protein [Legionella sp. PATHC035]MCW8409188.1 leucine-rich repeat domain-containing protein [Legionella sp. PATHC035]